MAHIEKAIGLVSATITEFNIFSRQLSRHGFQLLQESEDPNFRWISGLFEGKKVVLVKSGIGKVNAAGATQHIIDDFHPDIVIGLGVAGLLDPTLPVGSVVITDSCAEWDLDLSALEVQPERQTSHGVILDRVRDFVGDQCVIGAIISGDTFVADSDKREGLRNKHGAIAVDMESAAIAGVCNRNKIPFLAIKGISDHADFDAVTALPQNIEKATLASFDVLKQLIVQNVL